MPHKSMEPASVNHAFGRLVRAIAVLTQICEHFVARQ